MSRRGTFLLCVVPALSTVPVAFDERHAARGARTTADAGERGAPALFSWADFDGDGRLDLAAVGADGELQLLADAGDGRFEDVTERVGLSGIANAALALWADYDGDGRLDLFTGARAGASRLFRNEGGTFIDWSAGSGLLVEGAVQSAHWLDHDGDGRLDLHVVTDRTNLLFHGLEGGFFDASELPRMVGTGAPFLPGEELGSPETGSPPPSSGTTGDGDDAAGQGTSARPALTDVVRSSGSRAVLGPTPSTPGSASLLGFPLTCAVSIRDQANPSSCLQASTTPTLGLLYPLSTNLFVAVSGNVGIGTASPAARLEVAGTARITDTLTLAPAGDTALDVSSGSIYKGGLLFLHTKGGAGNTGMGLQALSGVTTGYKNTASGYMALRSNTIGGRNTASGHYSLYSNTEGWSNTATGAEALRFNTYGIGNMASGFGALRRNTIGFRNTASGARALYNNTSGYTNTASGYQALHANTTGDGNTASGYRALYSNTTGNGNTANGAHALYDNTTGIRNTANGVRALYSNTTGNTNTANGYRALYYNTTGSNNTASGHEALHNNTAGMGNTASGAYALFYNTGNANTANGVRALAYNTTANGNTANGYRALATNTTGARNTASGGVALSDNTTGDANTANGYGALESNTTGARNTASGERALASNTTGNANTANGYRVLFSNTTGPGNTASGYRALYSNTTGNDNTGSGTRALYSNTSGRYNTASGYRALVSNTTGLRNVALGSLAGSSLTTGNDNIDIGNTGVAGEGATIRVGTAGTHTRAFLAGARGVTTGVANAIPVLVDSSGQLGTVSSSRRFKEEIRDMGDTTRRLLELRPVVFRYKPEVQSGERPLEYGLIAEEVAEVFPDLVVYGEEGQPFTVKYHLLSAMLLNELQELDDRLQTQARVHERELAELRDRLAVLEESVTGAPRTEAR